MKHTKELFYCEKEVCWASIQKKVEDAVVQVVAEINRINWLEPYQHGEQEENRGTGFFITKEGYIVTTAHIINQARQIWIQMPCIGQQQFSVDLVGCCFDKDIALLKLSAESCATIKKTIGRIPHLKLGDSDDLKRAQTIMVLGYQLGEFRLKSTTGVVSGREFINGYSLIQITAPINQGSSGGPLIDMHGNVVGFAVATLTNTYNMGYIIPINSLHSILDDLYCGGLIRKPIFGGRFSFMNKEQAAYLAAPHASGIYICQVFKGGFFEQVGVREGDILTHCNEFAIDNFGDLFVDWTDDKISLQEFIARLKIGDQLHLTLYRKGKKITLSGNICQPQLLPIRTRYPQFESIDYEIVAGMVIMELTDDHINVLTEYDPTLLLYHQESWRTKGALVITHLFAGSYSYRSRILYEGDIITQVDEKPVTNLAQFRKALQTSITSGFLTITTKHNILAVFSWQQIIAEEVRLSADFRYPISKIVAGALKSKKEK